MSDGSTIEWLDRPGTKPASWNPIRAARKVLGQETQGAGSDTRIGWYCEHVHEGCRFCYAESFNLRLGNGLEYKPGNRDQISIFLDEKTLLQPLKWKSPRTIFVCSMTDLYGPWVKDEWLDKIKAVQTLTPQHTYIELTKRPERMRDYAMNPLRRNEIELAAEKIKPNVGTPFSPKWTIAYPLPNVWGLVSCSTQEDADKFIPILLSTPLAIRGVSAEPLLGPIDFDAVPVTVAPGFFGGALRWHHRGKCHLDEGIVYPTLDWIIVGGESGRNARPMHPDWTDSINAQCEAAGTAFFMKQWGEWAPHMGSASDGPSASSLMSCTNYHNFYDGAGKIERQVFRVGKTRAGRLLNGALHNGFPQARTT